MLLTITLQLRRGTKPITQTHEQAEREICITKNRVERIKSPGWDH